MLEADKALNDAISMWYKACEWIIIHDKTCLTYSAVGCRIDIKGGAMGDDSTLSKKCPGCGKKYTDIRRAKSTAGNFNLITGELEPPLCLGCLKREDKKSEELEKAQCDRDGTDK